MRFAAPEKSNQREKDGGLCNICSLSLIIRRPCMRCCSSVAIRPRTALPLKFRHARNRANGNRVSRRLFKQCLQLGDQPAFLSIAAGLRWSPTGLSSPGKLGSLGPAADSLHIRPSSQSPSRPSRVALQQDRPRLSKLRRSQGHLLLSLQALIISYHIISNLIRSCTTLLMPAELNQ